MANLFAPRLLCLAEHAQWKNHVAFCLFSHVLLVLAVEVCSGTIAQVQPDLDPHLHA